MAIETDVSAVGDDALRVRWARDCEADVERVGIYGDVSVWTALDAVVESRRPAAGVRTRDAEIVVWGGFVSINYPLKRIHIIEGEHDADGKPRPGAIVTLELTNGDFIRRVDPKTRQSLPEPQEFIVQDNNLGLIPRPKHGVADFKLDR